MSFINFCQEFYKKYIGWGEYQTQGIESNPRGFGVFSYYHITISLILILFIILFTFCTRKYSSDKLSKAERRISWIMIILEIFRFAWYRYYQGFWYFKYDICNIICLLMPIFVLIKNKTFALMWAALAFYGGCGVLLYPYGVFASLNGLHIVSIQSMISHGLMVLSSVNLARLYKINFKKDLLYSLIGYLIISAFIVIMCFVKNTNYMALLDPSGIPLVEYLPVPLSSIAIIGLIYLGIYLYLLVLNKFQIKKFLCVDLKEQVNNELQESNTTL